MTIAVDKRLAAAYADAVVAGRDPNGEARAKLDLVCRRAGVDPEVLITEALRRVSQDPA